MTVFRSIAQYRRSLQKRIRKVSQVANSKTHAAALYLSATAKRNAPRDTGRLVKSIRVRKLSKGRYSVVGGYTNNNFNVGKWTNMELNNSVKRQYPTRNATSRVNPWWTKAIESTRNRYRKSYKQIVSSLRS